MDNRFSCEAPRETPKVLMFDASTKGNPEEGWPCSVTHVRTRLPGVCAVRDPAPRDVSLGLQSQLGQLVFLAPFLQCTQKHQPLKLRF